MKVLDVCWGTLMSKQHQKDEETQQTGHGENSRDIKQSCIQSCEHLTELVLTYVNIIKILLALSEN